MKTEVSIPDDVFRQAEALARSMGISRSELYAKALATFVVEHDSAGVTERLNEIYLEQESKLDPVLEKMQFMSVLDDDG